MCVCVCRCLYAVSKKRFKAFYVTFKIFYCLSKLFSHLPIHYFHILCESDSCFLKQTPKPYINIFVLVVCLCQTESNFIIVGIRNCRSSELRKTSIKRKKIKKKTKKNRISYHRPHNEIQSRYHYSICNSFQAKI